MVQAGNQMRIAITDNISPMDIGDDVDMDD